jgi:porphobilinogen synthase
MNLLQRPRRNRRTEIIRDLVQENTIDCTDLILPLFLIDGSKIKSEIKSMPGTYKWSIDEVLEEIGTCIDLGIRAFAPFPNISENLKDKYAKESYRPDNLYLRAIEEQVSASVFSYRCSHGPI